MSFYSLITYSSTLLVLCFSVIRCTSNGPNLARNGTANQSSTFNSGGCSPSLLSAGQAIDSVSSVDANPWCGLAHTDQNGEDSWWKVDLGRLYPIRRVVIYGRTENESPHNQTGLHLLTSNHSSPPDPSLRDKNWTEVLYHPMNTQKLQIINIYQPDPIRHLAIYRDRGDVVTLEVEVYGNSTEPAFKRANLVALNSSCAKLTWTVETTTLQQLNITYSCTNLTTQNAANGSVNLCGYQPNQPIECTLYGYDGNVILAATGLKTTARYTMTDETLLIHTFWSWFKPEYLGVFGILLFIIPVIVIVWRCGGCKTRGGKTIATEEEIYDVAGIIPGMGTADLQSYSALLGEDIRNRSLPAIPLDETNRSEQDIDDERHAAAPKVVKKFLIPPVKGKAAWGSGNIYWEPEGHDSESDNSCSGEEFLDGYLEPDEWLSMSVLNLRRSVTIPQCLAPTPPVPLPTLSPKTLPANFVNDDYVNVRVPPHLSTKLHNSANLRKPPNKPELINLPVKPKYADLPIKPKPVNPSWKHNHTLSVWNSGYDLKNDASKEKPVVQTRSSVRWLSLPNLRCSVTIPQCLAPTPPVPLATLSPKTLPANFVNDDYINVRVQSHISTKLHNSANLRKPPSKSEPINLPVKPKFADLLIKPKPVNATWKHDTLSAWNSGYDLKNDASIKKPPVLQTRPAVRSLSLPNLRRCGTIPQCLAPTPPVPLPTLSLKTSPANFVNNHYVNVRVPPHLSTKLHNSANLRKSPNKSEPINLPVKPKYADLIKPKPVNATWKHDTLSAWNSGYDLNNSTSIEKPPVAQPRPSVKVKSTGE